MQGRIHEKLVHGATRQAITLVLARGTELGENSWKLCFWSICALVRRTQTSCSYWWLCAKKSMWMLMPDQVHAEVNMFLKWGESSKGRRGMSWGSSAHSWVTTTLDCSCPGKGDNLNTVPEGPFKFFFFFGRGAGACYKYIIKCSQNAWSYAYL